MNAVRMLEGEWDTGLRGKLDYRARLHGGRVVQILLSDRIGECIARLDDRLRDYMWLTVVAAAAAPR